MEKVTGFATGITNSLTFGYGPEFLSSDDPDYQRNKEAGEILGNAIPLAMSRGAAPPTVQVQPVGISPVAPVTVQVTTPTVTVTDVHGQVSAKKTDGKQFNDVCRQLGIRDKKAFSEYLHKIQKLRVGDLATITLMI